MKETSDDSVDTGASDFLANFLSHHSPPQEAIDYFRSVPWLAKYMADPVYQLIPTFSRHLKHTGEDYYFSRTINTLATIPHMITLQLRDLPTPSPTDRPAPNHATSLQTNRLVQTIAPEYPDTLAMISLGKQGVDGHPGILHGGVACAILDEMMGLLIMLHYNKGRGPGNRDALFTANLNVSYRAPISTPGDYLVKLWATHRQGRKWFSKGQITDRHGKVLAEGDALWVVTARSKV